MIKYLIYRINRLIGGIWMELPSLLSYEEFRHNNSEKKESDDIKIGDIFQLKNMDKDPFFKPAIAEIKDVQSGFVKYQFMDGGPYFSLDIKSFSNCYFKV